MKRFAVVFDENNARIVKGPDVDSLAGKPNVLVNPEIPPGVPPHHFKIEDGKISIITDEEEIKRREEFLHGHKLEKKVEEPPALKPFSRHIIYYPLVAAVASILTALVIHFCRFH